MCRENIRLNGLENKDKQNKNNTKNLKVFFKEKLKENLVGGYLRIRGRFILSNTTIRGSVKMKITDNKIEFESSSESYEEIVQKLVEVLIYLKQEDYNENRSL